MGRDLLVALISGLKEISGMKEGAAARRGSVAGLVLTVCIITALACSVPAFASIPAPSISQECPNQAIRLAQHTTYLANCRGIELVNNPDKGNQNAFAEGPRMGSSPMSEDGEEALWTVNGGAPGAPNGTANTFLAKRTESGWRSQSIVPPPAEQVGGGAFVYPLEIASPGFSSFIFRAGQPLAGGLNVGLLHPTFVRLDRTQNQEVLATYPEMKTRAFLDITSDGSHVLLVDEETRQLQDIGTGTPEVVSLMPDDTPSSCGLDIEGGSFVGKSGSGGAAGTHWRPGYQMIAVADASRVYFQARPNGECGKPLGIYARNREAGTTTLIDPGTETSPEAPEFIRATPDGRSAYFTTNNKLDPADTNEGIDVYRWDEADGQSVCLTCVVPDANLAISANHATPVMVSDDFSHIYFESTRQLVEGKGQEGDVNLYVLSAGTIRFVADTNETDGVMGAFQGRPKALLSSDGNVLLLMARPSANLTADDVPATCITVQGTTGPCRQLYRYDDRDGSIECLSCLHDGTTTHAVGTPSTSSNADFKMSSDGGTIAFATKTGLVPRDVNGNTDIYEWRNGAVSLITNGVSSFQTGFAAPAVRAVSANGSDILFTVVQSGMTGFEQDGLANVYDARVGGGFLPSAPPAHCSEDSCQGPLVAAPGLQAAISSTYSGRGNVRKKARPRCRRGKVRRHGRCVARHKRKHGQRKRRR